MRLERLVFALVLAVCVPRPTSAQVTIANLAEVVARAREQAPDIVSARLALDEVRARLVGVSLRFQDNPEIVAALGRRHGDSDGSIDLQVGFSQRFEPRARRTARVAGVNAAIAVASADVDETIRIVQREAASAYYRALHAAERQRLWAAAERLAATVEQAADRRFRAGDIAILDVNLARASRARASAERETAAASFENATGELQQLLHLDGTVSVGGTLDTPSDADLSALTRLALERPEIRRLDAAILEADAEIQLGRSLAKPEYAAGASYEREGGDRIVLGGLTITLPVFAKGQEQRAIGSARANRLRRELELTRLRVQIDVTSKYRAYQRAVSSLRVLQTDALPGLDENELLTNRSFEVGQIGLPDLLLIRREILDTRFQYLDALLEAALARIELHASAAILQ
jgi:cobalt-zinc-cadmium efflux system outer membrane protein